VNARFEATAEQYRRLAVRDINQADLQRYVQRVMGAGDKPSSRLKNIMGRITGLMDSPANDMTHIRGTYWAAYNAGTEWLRHARGRRAPPRVTSLWYGDAAAMNAQALAIALDMAG